MTPDLIRTYGADYLMQRAEQGDFSVEELRGITGVIQFLITIEALEDAVVGDQRPYAADVMADNKAITG